MEKDFKLANSSFEFIGEVISPKVTEYNNNKTLRLQMGIKTNESNFVFVDLLGTQKDKLLLMDRNNKKVSVLWNDRVQQSIIDNIADFKKIKVQLNSSDKIQEFISEYDAINYLKKINTGINYKVKGIVNFNRYFNVKANKYITSMKFVPSLIVVASNSDEKKSLAEFEFLFNKDSLDDKSLNEDKKFYVSCYVSSYDNDLKQKVFLPITLTFNGEKLDFSNTAHMAQLNYKKSYFKLKNNKYYATRWSCNVVRGVESTDITEDDLTDEQKKQIRAGVTTFEEIKSEMRKGIIKDRISEIRLLKPTQKFAEGIIETNFTDDSFIIPEKNEIPENIKTITSEDNIDSEEDTALF